MPPSCGFDTMGHFVCIKVCNPEPGRDGITQSQYAHPRKNFPAQAIWLQAVPPSSLTLSPRLNNAPDDTPSLFVLSTIESSSGNAGRNKNKSSLIEYRLRSPLSYCGGAAPCRNKHALPTLKCDNLVNNYLYFRFLSHVTFNVLTVS